MSNTEQLNTLLNTLLNHHSPLRLVGHRCPLTTASTKEFTYTFDKNDVSFEHEVYSARDKFVEMETHLLLMLAVSNQGALASLPYVRRIVTAYSLNPISDHKAMLYCSPKNKVFKNYQHWPAYFIFARKAVLFQTALPIVRHEGITDVTYSYSMKYEYVPGRCYKTDDEQLIP
jgi:hypothetical protein